MKLSDKRLGFVAGKFLPSRHYASAEEVNAMACELVRLRAAVRKAFTMLEGRYPKPGEARDVLCSTLPENEIPF